MVTFHKYYWPVLVIMGSPLQLPHVVYRIPDQIRSMINDHNVANKYSMAPTKSFHRLGGAYLSTVTKCFSNSLFKMVL